MSNASSKSTPAGRKWIGFVITLVRALFATFLGIALIFQPDKARPLLVNFMGVFWLASGVMSLRWGATGRRAGRRSIVAGAVGILAAVMVLTRSWTRGLVGEDLAFILLGGVMILTGIIHTIGGFHVGEDAMRKWSWTSFLLGVFEIVLGLLLATSGGEVRPATLWAATIWAFIGGVILMGDALRQRRRARQGN